MTNIDLENKLDDLATQLEIGDYAAELGEEYIELMVEYSRQDADAFLAWAGETFAGHEKLEEPAPDYFRDLANRLLRSGVIDDKTTFGELPGILFVEAAEQQFQRQQTSGQQ